jgi:hypothetical protein
MSLVKDGQLVPMRTLWLGQGRWWCERSAAPREAQLREAWQVSRIEHHGPKALIFLYNGSRVL